MYTIVFKTFEYITASLSPIWKSLHTYSYILTNALHYISETFQLLNDKVCRHHLQHPLHSLITESKVLKVKIVEDEAIKQEQRILLVFQFVVTMTEIKNIWEIFHGIYFIEILNKYCERKSLPFYALMGRQFLSQYKPRRFSSLLVRRRSTFKFV